MILTNAKQELLSAVGSDYNNIEALEICYKGHESETALSMYEFAKNMAADEIDQGVAHPTVTYDSLDRYPMDKIELVHYSNGNEISMLLLLDLLDFYYDSDHGAQELFGTVWLKDGSWLERSEYDGQEAWVHKCRPPMPFLNF